MSDGRHAPIYLDHHAAMPLRPRAEAAMRSLFDDAEAAWANPSSVHGAGRRAAAHLETAREQVAEALGAEPSEVIFTSGGTEACSMGIQGLLDGVRRVVSTAFEHPAVARLLDHLASRGLEVVRLRPGAEPIGEPELREALGDAGALLAVQWINHETGDVWPVARWARVARDHGARVFVDGCQALGKLPLELASEPFDAVAFGAAKVGGPAGCGALWLRRGVEWVPVARGGGQERGRRPGTPSVLLAVGFGAACEEVGELLREAPRLASLRDRLEAGLLALGGRRNGLSPERVGTVTNVSWQGLEADVLVAALDVEGVRVSAGPACSSGRARRSESVAAMYPEAPWRAAGAVRFSLGPGTSEAAVEAALAAVRRVLSRLVAVPAGS